MEKLNPTEQEKRHVLNWSEDKDSITVQFLKATEDVEDERQADENRAERAPQVGLNTNGLSHGKALIEKGQYNTGRDWDFSPEDGDRLIGEEDYSRFGGLHLGRVAESDPETKGYYRYPFGKYVGEKETVFRSGLTAIRQRAGQMKQEDIFDAAGELLDLIEEKEDRAEEKQKESRKYWDKKVVSRSANVEREFFEQEKEEDDRRVRVAFASEEPVERSFGYEILSHNEDAIDREFIESGRAPVLIDHDPSIDSQIGVVESISIGTDRKSRAVLRFSKESERADRVFRQIKEGIIQNISVGYYPLSMEKTEEEIEGRSVHVVKKWSPREISAVAIPADITVGIGRSESPNLIHRKEKNMTEEIQVQETPQVDANAIAEGIARNNKAILEKAAAAGRRDLGESAVSRGLSIEDFNGELIDAMVNNPLPTHHKIDMSQKEKKEFKRTYSLTNACKALSMGDWREAKYEQEISDEIQSRRGVKRGLSIPDEFWKMINDRKREQAMQTRVLTSGGATSGTQFVPVQVYGSEWIAALRAKMILPSLGVKFWEYRDKFNLPRVDTGSSVAYVSEGSAGAAQTPTTGSVSFVPYPITAYVDITREMMMMGDPQTDMWVAEDLTAAVATLLQSTAINGDGSSKPTGILQTSGIGNIAIGTNGGAPTWNHTVQIPQQVEIDDAALNDDTLYWLTNFKVKMKMAKTLKESSATNALMLLDVPYDRILGDPVRFTTGVPSNLTKGSSSGVCSALIYGDFSQLIVNLFGGTDVIVDPYSQSSAAVTRVVVYQDNDIGIRHAQSFSACQDVTTN